MANFKFSDSFMGMAQSWTPTDNINPLPAWEFMNQTGTLGTFLAGSVVYVGVSGTVKVIVAGTEGSKNAPASTGALTITTGGSGYTTATDVATTGGSGSGLKVSFTAVAGAVTAISAITVTGSKYAVGDVVTISGGGGNATLTITEVRDYPPTAADGVEFLNAQQGDILPVLVDYVVVPSGSAATDLVVGR
tara:strand:+ start:495 stop:1067 length:573 start_codon:yes stop_codon:yes gene_type:complete